jgi:NitT/TauT family transport system permease protein
LLVWLGFDILPKIATIVLVMTTTVAINIAAGFKDIEDEYLANVRAMGASKFEVAKNVYIPSLALWLLATSRVTFAFAFQAAVFTEILGSTGGVGYLILVGQTNFDVDTMFAGMVLLTIVALIVEYLLGAVEQRTTRWRPA